MSLIKKEGFPAENSNLLFPRPSLDRALQSARPKKGQVSFSAETSSTKAENLRCVILNRGTTKRNSSLLAQAFNSGMEEGVTEELSDLNLNPKSCRELRLSRMPAPVAPGIIRPRVVHLSSSSEIPSAAPTMLKLKKNIGKP